MSDTTKQLRDAFYHYREKVAARGQEPRESDVYAIVVETKAEGPILLETKAEHTSYDAVQNRATRMRERGDVVRVAVVRLEYVTGNSLLLADMERMQRDG